MEQGKKILVLGTLLVAIAGILLVFATLFRFFTVGFDENDGQIIGHIILACGAFLTSVHLWSRVPSFEKGTSIRTLFTMMGVTFIPIALVFVFFIFDSFLLGWAGITTVSNVLDNVVGSINIATFIDPEGLGSMRGGDVLWFSLIILGISFYIWPLEKFVKNRKPWFAASLWVDLGVIGIMVIGLLISPGNVNAPNYNLVITIILLVTVALLLINFIFMFYLYIKLGAVSAGKMRTASILVAFGLILMIMIWVANLALQKWEYVDFVVIGLGITSLTLFNAGFNLMRS